MEDDNKGWNQFKRIKLDRKQLTKRVKKAEGATQRHAHRFLVRRIDNVRLVSREITTWLVIVGVMIASLGLQLVWGERDYTTSAPVAGGVYAEGVVGELETLNPLFATTATEASVAKLVFSSLYSYDETGTLRQDIAKSMTANAEGTEYTIMLRDDVSWHDETPLNAKDIVYTINLIKNPAARSPLRVNWTDVSVSAVGDYGVKFTLPAAYAAFPHALTFPVLPEHLLESVAAGAIRESTFSRSPVGTGPFEFRLLQSADPVTNHKVVHLVANENYYAGSPKLDRFEVHAYEDEASILKALKSSEISGAAGVSVTSAKDVDTKRFNLTPQSIDSGVYLILNTTNPILKDDKVRKALQVGTDTKQLRENIGGGVQPLDGPILEIAGVAENLPKLPPANINEAKKMLDEAGWKVSGSYRVKDGKKLELTISTTKNAEYEKAVANVESQWQKLGVVVKKRVIDTSNVTSNFIQDTLQARNFDVLLYELLIGADPDVYAYWHSSQIGQSGYNFASYSNQAVDASLASARERSEPALRSAKYGVFVRQWQKDAPGIALYQPVLEYVSSKNVDSVDIDARLVTEADRFANVQYWTVATDSVYKTP